MLYGFVVWNLSIWSVRIRNVWTDLLPTTLERVWVSLFALTHIAAALIVLDLALSRRRRPTSRTDVFLAGGVAGWTVASWIVRSAAIVAGGHEAGFVAVHLVLAAVSIALGLGVWWAVRAKYAPEAMGQPISVIQKPSSRPGVLRFETNRSLTGMGKEMYASIDDIQRDRPPDRLARRLFESGGVNHVSVAGGTITVEVTDPGRADEIRGIIEDLYLFYQPGDEPQVVAE